MSRRAIPLAALLVLAACGGSGDADVAAPPTASSPATATSPATSASADGTAGAVPEALQFSAPLLGGGDIEMAGLAGRPVLLWFWAPW